MDNAQGPTGGGGTEIWASLVPSLQILYGQPHVFRAMNSWKRLSLSVTPGARKQMMSVPNADRRDFFPFPPWRQWWRRPQARRHRHGTGEAVGWMVIRVGIHCLGQ